MLVPLVSAVTLSEVPTVIVCAAAVAEPRAVIADTESFELNATAPPLAEADEIPVATDITPVPAEAPVESAIVGC